jgi:serine/threonine-protein kinase
MSWTLAGRYRLTSLVARGVTGEVWRAVDLGTDRPVAVKLLHPHLAADRRLADRLRQARRALTGLWHPGIARLVDIVVADGTVALVADFVPGTDLATLLASTGPLPPVRAATVAAGIADALAVAHQAEVVHGDLKPSNVMVSPDGRTVQLTDFSVATLVRVGRSPGRHDDPSPYSAPWVIDGAVPARSCDVHALGVVLFEMLTGSTSRQDPAVERVDRRLLTVVDWCVLGDQAARPSAEAVSEQLRSLGPRLAEDSLLPALPARSARSAPRHSPPPPRRAGGRRLRTRLALGGAAVAVLVAGTVAGVASLRPEGTDDPATAPSASDPTSVADRATAPALPPTAASPSQEAGGEFVRYWFATLTYGVQTGDVEDLNLASSPDCQDCQDAIGSIEETYRTGGALRGGAYVVRNVSTTSLWSAERPVYDATVDRSVRTEVDAGGEAGASLPALSFANCVVVLEWTDDGRWRVREVVSSGCVG